MANLLNNSWKFKVESTLAIRISSAVRVHNAHASIVIKLQPFVISNSSRNIANARP